MICIARMAQSSPFGKLALSLAHPPAHGTDLAAAVPALACCRDHGEERAMSEPIWNRFLTERDKAVFAAGGFGARAGFGRRPALLVIDVNWAFCGERPEPILEAVKRWRTSCGEDAWVALPYIKRLIDKAHVKGLPVIYTTGEGRADKWDRGSWAWKSGGGEAATAAVRPNVDGNEIVSMIAPAPQDIVIKKQKPSGFFGSSMASFLTLLGADSVVVVGTTTSGCVRATAVDAFSLNYRVILAEEGCFDRSEASHALSLCDMHAKYADVVPTEEVLAYFDRLPDRLFDLPGSSRASAPPASQAAE
jgi:nicotinamidase-related amidase